ncbi:MAG: DUF2569 family protein [Deltaproteobacteria bacterium]
METVKKIIAVCYCFAIILSIMIVPWKLDYHSETISRKIDKGYAFLFSPPIPAATIDFSMILLEIIFITTVTAIIYVMRDNLFKNGDPNGRMNKTKIKKLVGVHGWLLFLVVSMMVLGPLMGVGNIASDFFTVERQNPSLASSDVWRTFTTAIMWVFAGFSAISFYGGWGLTQVNSQSAVMRAKVILWITGPVSSLVLWLMVPFLVFDNYAVDAQFVRSFISTLVSASIWTLYLSKSKRVHNTYGET